MSTAGSTMRAHVIAMYRAFLREARLMPTPNRRTYIEQKAREKFRAHASESDPEQLAEMVAVGEVQLETARVQRVHLNALAAQGNLKGPKC